MSSAPFPQPASCTATASSERNPSRPGADRQRKADWQEAVQTLKEWTEKAEKIEEGMEKAFTSARAKALNSALAGSLKGVDLHNTNVALLKSKAILEKLSKVMKGWSYGALAVEFISADTKAKRKEALDHIGYTIVKDGTPAAVKLAKELGYLSKKISTKEFLEKLLGRVAVLAVEGAELPVYVVVEVFTPTKLGDGTISGAIDRQRELCDKLANEHSSNQEIHACMARVLSMQRGTPFSESPSNHNTPGKRTTQRPAVHIP